MAKNARAVSFFSNFRRRSSGTVAVVWESYAAFHRPSAFARSTSCSPAGFIRLSSMSFVALSRLTFDHLLLALRSVNRCSQNALSKLPFWPANQPWQRSAPRAST